MDYSKNQYTPYDTPDTPDSDASSSQEDEAFSTYGSDINYLPPSRPARPRRSPRVRRIVRRAQVPIKTTHSTTTSTPSRSSRRRQFSRRESATSVPMTFFPRAPIPPPLPPIPPQFQRKPPSANDALHGINSLIQEVFVTVFWILKKPLAFMIAMYLVAVVLAFGYNHLRRSVLTAMTPLCVLPLEFPFCDRSSKESYSGGSGGSGEGGSKIPQLIDLQSSFEGVLENSVGGSVMALDLKNSEMAVRDLNTLVRSSSLVCKRDLSHRLDEFVNEAKQTSRQLSKFSSGVGGTVDKLLAMDEYAIKSLEAVAAASLPHSHQQAGIVSLLLAPFRAPAFTIAEAEREVWNTFSQASQVMDTSIRRLILEASTTLHSLDNLESRLVVIDEVVRKEAQFMEERHQEVLAHVWTLLGGNRDKIKNFKDHKQLLGNIGLYRTKALAHVSASLILLQTMQADLEELREKVVGPALEETPEVPLEVHIQSIRKGVDRLAESMRRAKRNENEQMMRMLNEHDDALRMLDARGAS